MNVKYADSFEIQLGFAREDSRRRILAWVEYLKNWETDEFVRQHSQYVGPIEGIGDEVYELRTSDDYVIFFKIEGDSITVLHATSSAWLDEARKKLAETK